MAIRFSCPHCDKPLKVVDEKIGKKVICSGCGKPCKVPESDAISMEQMGVRRRSGAKRGESYEELISSYGNSEYGTTSRRIDSKQSLKLLLRPVIIIAVIVAVLVGFYLLGTSLFS